MFCLEMERQASSINGEVSTVPFCSNTRWWKGHHYLPPVSLQPTVKLASYIRLNHPGPFSGVLAAPKSVPKISPCAILEHQVILIRTGPRRETQTRGAFDGVQSFFDRNFHLEFYKITWGDGTLAVYLFPTPHRIIITKKLLKPWYLKEYHEKEPWMKIFDYVVVGILPACAQNCQWTVACCHDLLRQRTEALELPTEHPPISWSTV